MNRSVALILPFLVIVAGCESSQCTAPQPYHSAKALPELVVPDGLNMPPPSTVPQVVRAPAPDSPCLELPPGMRNRDLAGNDTQDETEEEEKDAGE